MAPRPTTKRRDTGLEDATVSILEHFRLPGAENEAKKAAQNKPGASPADLQAQIEALNRRLDEAQRTNTALMSQPVQSTAMPANQADIVVDTKGLPDPVTDTENYTKELSKRTLDALRAQQRRDRENDAAVQTQQQSLDQRANTLWEDFQKAYPNYAENDDRVRFIAEDVARNAKARGVDLDKYMFGPGRTQYMRDVAEKYEVMWPTADGDDDGTEPTTQQRPQASAADRTTGTFGGAESGGRPTKPAAVNPNQAQPGSLTRDLNDLQRASGLF